jgi:hypothetical protein
MPDYTEYTAVILALVELRAQVADDITRTHLSARSNASTACGMMGCCVLPCCR